MELGELEPCDTFVLPSGRKGAVVGRLPISGDVEVILEVGTDLERADFSPRFVVMRTKAARREAYA